MTIRRKRGKGRSDTARIKFEYSSSVSVAEPGGTAAIGRTSTLATTSGGDRAVPRGAPIRSTNYVTVLRCY